MIRNDRKKEISVSAPNIPGYLKCEENNNFFAFRSGREAIIALIRALKLDGETVLLPSHLPEGIYAPFTRSGCKIIYYKLDRKGNADLGHVEELINNSQPPPPRLALFIHYFGVSRNIDPFMGIVKKYQIPILEDLAHSYFSNSQSIGVVGNFILFSLPKIIGIPDGGILVDRSKSINLDDYKNDHLLAWIYSQLKAVALFLSAKPNFKKLEAVCNIISYRILTQYFQKPTSQSRKSRIAWEYTDHEFVVNKRREYAKLYQNNINNPWIEIDPGLIEGQDVLMGFPVYTNERDKLEAFLLSSGIKPLKFVKRWGYLPSKLESEFEETKKFKNTHLLLPVTHFNSLQEIQKIIETINSFNP